MSKSTRFSQFRDKYPHIKALVIWPCAYCAQLTIGPRWNLRCRHCGAPKHTKWDVEFPPAVSQIARRL